MSEKKKRQGTDVVGLVVGGFVVVVLISLLIAFMTPNLMKIKPKAGRDGAGSALTSGENTKSTVSYLDDNPNALVLKSRGERAPEAASLPPSSGGVKEASLDWMAQSAYAAEISAMMVYNGEVAIMVEDGTKAAETVLELLAKKGGYLKDTAQYGKDDELVIQMTVKVPSGKFWDFLKELESVGEIESQSATGTDVSEEYFDLEARREALELSLERLKALLKKSGKLTDLLSIEKEVTRTQENLNRVNGRMKQLDHWVAFSTVDITLSLEPVPDIYEPPKFSWLTNTAFGTSWAGFLYFTRGLWHIALFFAAFAPYWVPILLIVLFIKARRRRKRRADGEASTS